MMSTLRKAAYRDYLDSTEDESTSRRMNKVRNIARESLDSLDEMEKERDALRARLAEEEGHGADGRAADKHTRTTFSIHEVRVGQPIRGVHFKISEKEREEIATWFARDLMGCVVVLTEPRKE